MKTTLLFIASVSFLLAGCGQSEEKAEPLSPEAQAALKSGQTGPPPQSRGSDPQAQTSHATPR